MSLTSFQREIAVYKEVGLMKINHISIYTNDLERMKEFYVKYFSGKPNDKYHNPKSGLQTYFVTFESGAKLEIMTRAELVDRNGKEHSIGFTHLAFSVGSREKVDLITERIVGDGYLLKSAPRITGDGYYESCIFDPDGNEIEVTV